MEIIRTIKLIFKYITRDEEANIKEEKIAIDNLDLNIEEGSFVAVLGQINIGLSSLEQRTQELLIRRALGASKNNIAILVLSSLVFLSIIVCLISLFISVGIVYMISYLLPSDSPITVPGYPVIAAFVAVIASIGTALLGGLIPAIKAARLEPALALR